MELQNEDDLTLWIMRVILRESEQESASSRHEVEDELFKRMSEQDATKIPIGSDMYVTQHQQSDYAYTADGVNRLKEFLVGGRLVSEKEWSRAVTWTPKVNRHDINRWLKLGSAVTALVDQATMGHIGSKSRLVGPGLKELQKKRPDAVAEAAGKV